MNSSGDMDSKKIIALVGTDKLDGSELDNVKTGLTPPCQSVDFFDNQYSVEDIATPMRFDEEELELIPVEIQSDTKELFSVNATSLRNSEEVNEKRSEFSRSSIKGFQYPIEVDPTSLVYSTQLSKICLDDILPIINRDTTSDESRNSSKKGTNDHLKWETSSGVTKSLLATHHSWDIPTASYVHAIETSRQSNSTGSLPKPKKQFICSYETCRRKFNRSDELNRHLRVHSGIKPYTCEFCFKKFARSDHLKTHRRTHTGERPFECEICAKKFARSDEKSRHSKTHSKGRGLSRISTAPEFEPNEAAEEEKAHRSSDGSITYKF